MPSIIRFLVSVLVVAVTIVAGWYAYDQYGRDYLAAMLEVPETTLFVNSIPLSATVADTPAERAQGLSGVTALADHEVLLFVFDEDGYHGIWMKDMLIAIDIFWLDATGKVIHIEENVSPRSYPTIFEPPRPARFVLEGNAFLADSLGIVVGDEFTIPTLVSRPDWQELQ